MMNPDATGPSAMTGAGQRAVTGARCGWRERALSDEPGREINHHTALMLAVRDRRDREAFAALFDHFAPRLKSMLMRSGATSADAEDIAQEALVTLWQKAHLFDARRAQVSSWLYQIARNRHVDRQRKASRPVPEEIHASGEDVRDVADVIGFENEVEALRRALAALSEGQREIIDRAYVGDASQTEISAATGLPLGTVKSRIRSALEKLRHELKHLRPS
jgi:RNA polymerase sigma-70 factor (ECF subfamily)